MNARQLIGYLEKLNPDAEVVVHSDNGTRFLPIVDIYDDTGQPKVVGDERGPMIMIQCYRSVPPAVVGDDLPPT